ncbi:MAG TPA: hypothetical protein VGX91_00070 [Candidatus Cybelea sp.]|jgi:hypothetical protein|nr:hypothetical protein [Candidatus Cybelea sp.]
MRIPDLGRFALSSCAAAAFLVGCGESSPPIGAPGVNAGPLSYPYHAVFEYTGKKKFFKVPHNVTSLTMEAVGAGGASQVNSGVGRGGRVYAVVPVTPGESLIVNVGGAGSGTKGGYNGGGSSGYFGDVQPGYGGGGASDVRRNDGRTSVPILVAGGGGGQGGYDYVQGINYGQGGDGGGTTAGRGKLGWPGESSSSSSTGAAGNGGTGGTRRSGGGGGAGGYGDSGYGETGGNGTHRGGGAGGSGCIVQSSSCVAGGSGGGGGGGYYGGGGGGAAGACCSYRGAGGGGGGGGSSYIEPTATHVQISRGWKSATYNGSVVFSWL